MELSFFLLTLGFLIASFIQGAAGFAFGLLTVPLLVWSGFSLAESSLITVINAFAITSIMVIRFRRYIKWRLVLNASILRIIALSIGVVTLTQINGLDKSLTRQLLGLLLLIIVLVQLTIKPKPREKLHRAWWWLAFSSGGFLTGLVGFGGPPVVLWVMAHNWTSVENRSLTNTLYWAIIPVHIILLFSSFGESLLPAAQQGILFIPIVVSGVFIGFWFGDKLNVARLKLMTQLLLLAAAASALLAPLFTS